MIVKICGIQTIEAAIVATEAGADMIGFVFARSSRQVSPQQAAGIAKHIPSTVKKVGVFVNEKPSKMKEIAETVGLDIIQLHGDEQPTIVNELPYSMIKAYSIDQVDLLAKQMFPCDYYLIDSPPTTYRGGSGKSFDWDLTTNLPIDRNKMILAGGLTPENVQQAITKVNPAGVDVSSGVETNGAKDHEKIKQFLTNAKG